MANLQKWLKDVTCATIGHSKILTACFGYHHCGRCGVMVGDSLAGAFDGEGCVIVGCKCKKCPEVYKTLGWRDKFLSARPTFLLLALLLAGCDAVEPSEISTIITTSSQYDVWVCNKGVTPPNCMLNPYALTLIKKEVFPNDN